MRVHGIVNRRGKSRPRRAGTPSTPAHPEPDILRQGCHLLGFRHATASNRGKVLPMTQDRTEQFKFADAESYDTVNASFDKYARRFSAPLARRMVALAALSPGHAVLDLGTGTGLAAMAAAAAVGDGGSVVGLDLSDGMLAIARAGAGDFGLTGRLRFVKGDAERPDFPDGSFDAVLALFSLLHLPHPDEALRQMLRVLKPGGSLVIAVGSGPPLFSVPGFFHRVRRAVGLAREKLGKELRATAFLDRLVERALPTALDTEMPAWTGGRGVLPGGIPARIQAVGFCDVREYWEGHISRLDTTEEFWELQATYSSFARKRLAAAPPERLAALRHEFDERCRAVLARGGRLVYPYGAAFYVARRPSGQ